MIKLFIIILRILLLCGFRAPNGNIISKGDLADKLIVNMGEPHQKNRSGDDSNQSFWRDRLYQT